MAKTNRVKIGVHDLIVEKGRREERYGNNYRSDLGWYMNNPSQMSHWKVIRMCTN